MATQLNQLHHIRWFAQAVAVDVKELLSKDRWILAVPFGPGIAGRKLDFEKDGMQMYFHLDKKGRLYIQIRQKPKKKWRIVQTHFSDEDGEIVFEPQS